MTAPATVHLWGVMIGAVSYAPGGSDVAVFEYHPDFLDSAREVAPLMMPLRAGTFSFPNISKRTFKGLPGMLSDSLPDKFGNQLVDKHLANRGIPSEKITAMDRLHYVGARAMGALEYRPAQDFDLSSGPQGGILDLTELTELVNLTLSRTQELEARLQNAKTQQVAFDLLSVGTSAGGARAKALIALDPQDRPKVGHIDHGADHSYWILKFDGIDENKDRDRGDPPGTTVLEYIYSRIANQCAIDLPKCRLLELGEQRHFLIERFDRVLRKDKLSKVHYTSWCGMAHAHRDQTAAYSYEQLILTMRQLRLPQKDLTELFRRAVFNVIGRNQDDHTKNFGFTMSREGEWSLSPAFDLTYSFDPTGQWTKTHQISLGGKGNGFVRDDLIAFGRTCDVSPREANEIVDGTREAFSTFSKLATEYELPPNLKKTVQSQLRMTV